MEELNYHYKYPHPAVTTDCVIFGYDDTNIKVLLIQRGAEPYKDAWAFPGGFLNIDEPAEDGAKRELEEETGLKDIPVEQFYTFSTVDRDPRERVISIAYYALVKIKDVKGGDDAANARWFALDEIPCLAFDHDEVLSKAITHLKERIFLKPVGLELLPEVFTMEELQNLYEAILQRKIERRKFSNKILKLCILDEAENTSSKMIKQYRFNVEKYTELKQKGFILEF